MKLELSSYMSQASTKVKREGQLIFQVSIIKPYRHGATILTGLKSGLTSHRETEL